MGGYTALYYGAVAPADIKEKLCGIVSVEGTGDLKELCQRSKQNAVAAAIVASLGGTPEQAAANYQSRNFFTHMSGLPKNVRVSVVSAKADTIVPPDLQRSIVEAMQREHYPVKLIELKGAHGVPPAPVYIDALEFALGNS